MPVPQVAGRGAVGVLRRMVGEVTAVTAMSGCATESLEESPARRRRYEKGQRREGREKNAGGGAEVEARGECWARLQPGTAMSGCATESLEESPAGRRRYEKGQRREGREKNAGGGAEMEARGECWARLQPGTAMSGCATESLEESPAGRRRYEKGQRRGDREKNAGGGAEMEARGECWARLQPGTAMSGGGKGGVEGKRAGRGGYENGQRREGREKNAGGGAEMEAGGERWGRVQAGTALGGCVTEGWRNRRRDAGATKKGKGGRAGRRMQEAVQRWRLAESAGRGCSRAQP